MLFKETVVDDINNMVSKAITMQFVAQLELDEQYCCIKKASLLL